MRTEASTYYFTRSELTALLAHMSTDATRESQYGLVLKGGKAMSTDGHRAIICSSATESPAGQVMLPRGFVEKIQKLARKDSLIEIDDARARIDMATFVSELSTAVPPPTEQVMPKYDQDPNHTGSMAGFCGSYLADISLVTDACPPLIVEKPRGKKEKHYPNVRLYLGASEMDPLLAVVVCPANSTSWRVCLMPVRL